MDQGQKFISYLHGFRRPTCWVRHSGLGFRRNAIQKNERDYSQPRDCATCRDFVPSSLTTESLQTQKRSEALFKMIHNNTRIPGVGLNSFCSEIIGRRQFKSMHVNLRI